jgi:hypothetical protein
LGIVLQDDDSAARAGDNRRARHSRLQQRHSVWLAVPADNYRTGWLFVQYPLRPHNWHE